ncbi:DDE superfamily endonuclease [Phytophthora infestans]|uniref:DDE superfamily endonuclease n=1 Tax=Phytophthora infestans TaxID=4787 RepID=A0A8S9VB21_PHYIN|nr:DDE superfamily endonuclease [Phytophthora infestans]
MMIVFATGLCIPFYRLIEGRLHDSTMLRERLLLPHLAGNELVKDLGVIIYGDPVYGISELLCSPSRNAYVTSAETSFNVVMSKSRVSMEWFFGVVKNKWAFLDWNKKHQILLTPVASNGSDSCATYKRNDMHSREIKLASFFF